MHLPVLIVTDGVEGAIINSVRMTDWDGAGAWEKPTHAGHQQLPPPHHLAVGTLSLWWELWVINCQWMTCMNNGQVKLIAHTSSAVWGCGAVREQRFSQVEWFQFSLGDNSCSIMEQCTQVTKTQWNNEKWWCPFWVSASLVLLEKY